MGAKKDTGTWPTPEELARYFHDMSQHLAPRYMYDTGPHFPTPWVELPSHHRQLMIETSRRVLKWLRSGP